jgi:hypothetical protein
VYLVEFPTLFIAHSIHPVTYICIIAIMRTST